MSLPAAATRRRSVWLPATAVALPSFAIAAIVAAADLGDATTLPLALAIALLVLGALVRPFEPAPGEKFSLAAAIAFFAVLILPGAQAIGAIIAAETAARVLRRTSAVSGAVNVAKSAGAAGAAAATVLAFPDTPGPHGPLTVFAAGVAYLVLALAPIAVMIAWTQGARAISGFVAREWLPTATLLAIGAVGATAWLASPPLIILLALPLAMVEVAGRSAARLRAAHAAIATTLDAQRAFVADAAHELRNPLAAIRGNLAFIRESPLQPEESAALADARRDLTNLAALVERLLVLSRADAAAGIGTADLGAIARTVSEAVTRRPGVALALELADRVIVAAPSELIESLVRDLVANAAAYTERGSISVAVRAVAEDGELVVRDTGMGIAPADMPRVFDRFYRGSAARRLASGSGLGLAIARRIAEAHGGSISVASADGGGTIARALLPLARR